VKPIVQIVGNRAKSLNFPPFSQVRNFLRGSDMTFTRKGISSNQGRALSDLAAFAPLLPRIEAIVREAGKIALDYFRHGAPTHAEVSHKTCGSPVTEADLRIDNFLRAQLSLLAPQFGWLSEETADSPERLKRRALFVVDPIDGTRGFAAGDPNFAISVALVLDERPCFGVVHAPALDETYVATAGRGATRNGAPIAASARRDLPGASLTAPDSMAADLKRAGRSFHLKARLPSLAMRIVRVAEGALDLALARKNAYDWDIAAADLILREAGGALSDLSGAIPLYNQPDPRHPALIAGPAALVEEFIRSAREDDAGARSNSPKAAANSAPHHPSRDI
jgi:myo-inositol-1(or 4)-monophosphatase